MTALEEYITIEEKVTGNIHVTENTQYNNVDAESITVAEGIKARLFGTVHSLLIIKKNAKVFLHGQFFGKVEDEGGRFYHFNE